MKRPDFLLVAAALSIAVAFSGCKKNTYETYTESLPSNVSMVHLTDGNARITIKQGSPAKLVYTKWSHLSQNKFKVKGDELVIKNGTYDIEITLPNLESVEAGGNSRTTVSGFHGSDLYVRVWNNGTVSFAADALPEAEGMRSFAGNTPFLDLVLLENGTFEGFDRSIKRCRVKVEANGEANVQVEIDLEARILSNGRINYKGSPAITYTQESAMAKLVDSN